MASGLLGELETPTQLVSALVELRKRGYTRLAAYSPYPVMAAEEALQLRRSSIPRLVLAFGLLGAAVAYALQYWTAAVDYPVMVGGMPAHSGPAFIPITFETMVLLSGLTAFVTFFKKSGLPRLYQPIFDATGFESAAVNRFWVSVDAHDPEFSRDDCEQALIDAGALRVLPYGLVSRGEHA